MDTTIRIDRIIVLESDEEIDSYDVCASADYAINFIYDRALDKVICHVDNIHGTPDVYLEGYIFGAERYTKCKCEVRNGVLRVPEGASVWSREVILMNYDNVIWED